MRLHVSGASWPLGILLLVKFSVRPMYTSESKISNRRDHCDAELKLMLFLSGGRHGGMLSPTVHLFRVFQAANNRR